MNRTLVVIDMQPRFSTSTVPRVLDAVEREMAKAVARQEPIIILEYDSKWEEDGVDTHQRLLSVVDQYPKAVRVHKTKDDGSKEVLQSLTHIPDELIITGVNSNCCVAETVNGLANKLPNTKLVAVADAIHGHSDYDHVDTRIRILHDLKKMPVTIRRARAMENKE